MAGETLRLAVCGLVALLIPVAAAADNASRHGNRQIQSLMPIKSSIRRDGDSATMFVLFSYRRMQTGYVTNADKPQAFYYHSTRSGIEFDCREHRSRILRTVFFSDRTGRGNVVHQHESPGGWMHDDDHDRKDGLSFIACQSPLDPQ